MHAWIDGGKATLLTRTGPGWSHRYRRWRLEHVPDVVRKASVAYRNEDAYQ